MENRSWELVEPNPKETTAKAALVLEEKFPSPLFHLEKSQWGCPRLGLSHGQVHTRITLPTSQIRAWRGTWRSGTWNSAELKRFCLWLSSTSLPVQSSKGLPAGSCSLPSESRDFYWD